MKSAKNADSAKSGKSAKTARFGEKHWKAVLSDHEVELIRQMHEEFPRDHPRHLGYVELSRIFEVPKTTIVGICIYRTRVPK